MFCIRRMIFCEQSNSFETTVVAQTTLVLAGVGSLIETERSVVQSVVFR